MTTAGNSIQPGEQPPTGDAVGSPVQGSDDIVSVNKKGSGDNKLGKGLFLLVAGAVLVGVLAWMSQNWLNGRKADAKASSGPKAAADTTQVFNPEKTGAAPAKPKLGTESGLPAPSALAASSALQSGVAKDDGIRALRGSDGKAMVNAQGRAMGVDRDGNVVEVPAIAVMGGESAGRKPLPGETAGGRGQAQAGAQQGQQKPPSRYAGSLFVGDPSKPLTNPDSAATTQDPGAATAPRSTAAQSQAQQIVEIMRLAGLGGGAPAQKAGVGAAPSAPGQVPGAGSSGGAEPARPGTVGSALYSTATPVALAKRMPDQNLILPKGRQADCVLTGRIVDEVPGFTSCVLAQNLYSDNGRVLLLERGSELTGEYGVLAQLGLERIFVTWTRLKTPEGIEIDLSSPGSDRLGTSGVPGQLDNRWGARIGAAFLLSFVKDVTVALINKEAQSGAGSTVNVQTSPGQNTANAASSLAEEVIKQTIKVRPRLTINEGERVSIYVARDLDFSPVYTLKTAGTGGAVRLPAR